MFKAAFYFLPSKQFYILFLLYRNQMKVANIKTFYLNADHIFDFCMSVIIQKRFDHKL